MIRKINKFVNLKNNNSENNNNISDNISDNTNDTNDINVLTTYEKKIITMIQSRIKETDKMNNFYNYIFNDDISCTLNINTDNPNIKNYDMILNFNEIIK